MNTDRELLKLAAKASGLYVVREVINHNDEFIGFRVKPSKNSGREMMVFWNALEDDGDALRLAAKLSLNIYIHQISAQAEYGNGPHDYVQEEAPEGKEDQILNATRRAIVRAAAFIGYAMP